MGTNAMSFRWRAIRVICLRELRSLFMGLGIYIVTTLVLLACAAGVLSFVGAVSDAGLRTSAEPLLGDFVYAIGALTLYIGILATIAVSRERDRGTLEVLFYGPVDSTSYVMAKFLEHLAAFAIVMVVTLAAFGIISAITGLIFTGGLVRAGILSLFFASTAISFGIFLSSITLKMRNSVVLFILIMVGLGLFSLLEAYLGLMLGEASAFVEYGRVVVGLIGRVLNWISPIAYYRRGIEAARIGDLRMLVISVLSPIIYTSGLLWLAAATFTKKGVRAQ
ncbi:MAG TPA: ABC transporter permease subunit [Firmicutes bacterium]|nr:ABC transporter permease subunit [Bacillota bacterium]